MLPLAALLSDPSSDVRQAAISSLSEFRDPAATDGFIAALRDKDAEVRAAAANALGGLELTSAPQGLIDVLKDLNADVRSSAANALGEIRDAKAVPGLRLLLEDSNGDVRESAINALSELRESTARDAIRGALNAKAANVCRHAASRHGPGACGTHAHRGLTCDLPFNEWHVLAISEASGPYRKMKGSDGPLFIGVDTHALSGPACSSAVEVLAANGVDVMLAEGDEYTPTTVVSHALLTYHRGL